MSITGDEPERRTADESKMLKAVLQGIRHADGHEVHLVLRYRPNKFLQVWESVQKMLCSVDLRAPAANAV